MPEPSALTPLLETAPGALGGQHVDRAALQDAVRRLRLPATIRERCANITAAVAADASAHFTLDRSKIVDVARRVARLTRERYPAEVPLHSRWRQFQAGGVDRKALLDARLAGCDAAEVARTRIDLVVVSALLDANAGPGWFYQEESGGRRYAQSEGLAVATLRAFLAGQFSSDLRVPLRVDARALEQFDAQGLARIFQAGDERPLVGLDSRALLLRRLGAALRERAEVFPGVARPGQLYDLFSHAAVRGGDGTVRKVAVGRIAAVHVLRAVLKAFSAIWPSGQKLFGKAVGDVWTHREAGGTGADAGRVPFHKLSQWLVYSLIEPLQWAGIQVDGIDELTGLTDVRSGGLLLDAGVIVPRDRRFAQAIYTVADPWVIEWRALTITLLDDVARAVRTELGAPALTLSQVMEGGTAKAGHQIADERRPGGPPPLRVAGDGTLF